MRQMQLLQKWWAVILLAIQPTCSLFDTGCDASAGNLLFISVIDSQTTHSIGVAFTLTVISEASGDSLILALPPDIQQPFNVRESLGGGGDYTVDVQAEGYQRWRRSRINVSRDACGHPKPRSVTAALLRL